MTGHIYSKRKPAEDEERVIMREPDASSSVTSESDQGRLDRKLHRTIRAVMSAVFHSNQFQIGIVIAVIICSLVVITELLIDLRFLEFPNESKTPAKALHYASIVFYGLFTLEMMLKLIAWGLQFFKHRLEIFDFVIILLTFSLVLAFGGKENSWDGIGLLIMFRLWRVTKILNSIVASVRKDAEKQMIKERRAKKALEREVLKLREYCLQQECELETLRLLLKQNNIPEPTVLKLPPAPRRLKVIAEVNEESPKFENFQDS